MTDQPFLKIDDTTALVGAGRCEECKRDTMYLHSLIDAQDRPYGPKRCTKCHLIRSDNDANVH